MTPPDSSSAIGATPRPAARRRRLLAWGAAVAAGGGLVALAVAPPFVSPPLRYVLMEAFATVCHQLPGRSPHVDGVQLAVCHRCLGIYLGLAAAALAFLALYRWDPFFRRHALLLGVVALIPLGLDWGGGVVGLWDNTPASRMLTGGVLGVVAGYFLARVLIGAITRGRPAWPTGADPPRRGT